MKKTSRKNAASAESIATKGERGEDVSRYFTNRGKMMQPIQRINLDVTVDMLQELDRAASELNVSRQAVIKVFIRHALDQHHLAQQAQRNK
jgi:prephenate dehydrogenase